MTTTQEGTHVLPDGFRLYTKDWKITDESKIKARLIFIHGFSDHCNTYGDFFPYLNSNGIEVYGVDQRGWGRSITKPAERGLTGPTTQVMADLDSYIGSILDAHASSSIPIFVMGHSMGGGEILTWAALGASKHRSRLRGIMAYSPWIGLSPATEPYSFTIALCSYLGMLLPWIQLYKPLEPSLLSRNPKANQDYVDDKLCHDYGTLAGFAGALSRGPNLISGKVVIKPSEVKSLWIGHGTKDAVCAFAKTEQLAKKIKVEDYTFKPFEGFFHRMHDEPNGDGQIMMTEVKNWILERS